MESLLPAAGLLDVQFGCNATDVVMIQSTNKSPIDLMVGLSSHNSQTPCILQQLMHQSELW